MQFLVFSDIDEGSIRDNLGNPEYSYFFVLKAFRPVLEQLGTVTMVRRPAEEVDPLYESFAAQGEPCVFVCCSPPDRVNLDLKCPTLVIFAWEFTTIPDGSWDPGNRQLDWRYVLRRLGHAICLSTHTAAVVRATLGDDFPIFPIAAPVWDRIARPASTAAGPDLSPRAIRLRGHCIDSWQLTLRPEMIFEPGFPPPIEEPVEEPAVPVEPVLAEPPPTSACEEPPPAPEPPTAPAMEPSPLPRRPGLRYRLAVTKRHILGVYREAVRDLVPRPVRWLISKLGFIIEASYRGLTGWVPPGTPLEPHPGVRYRLAVTKSHVLEWYREALRDLLPRALQRIVSRIGATTEAVYRKATGWKPPVVSPAEPVVPVAIAAIELEPELVPAEAPPPVKRLRPEITLQISGVVYTAVLNPTDGRKNWEDIVTGFVWAFRDNPNATLLLKMVKSDPRAYRHALFIMLAQLAPFRCRIVAIDAFLEDEAYSDLIARTTYYVNASNAEGLCLPLMEFMALGKPAIAPRHTAMADYVDPSVAFIVESSPEHNVWPNDPRMRFNTMRERIHWDTLVDAYRDSYRVVTEDLPRYRAMCAQAGSVMERYSSDAAIREQMRIAVASVLAANDSGSAEGRAARPASESEPLLLQAEAV